MTDPRSLHTDHDRLLVVALASGDLDSGDRHAAARLVAGCVECASLHRDVLAITAATRSLPAPPRSRDFTLTAADARRVQRRGWRAALHALASPRFAIAQPLGAAFAALGLAGFLLASLPAVPVVSTAAPSVDQMSVEVTPQPDAAAGYGPRENDGGGAASARPMAAPSTPTGRVVDEGGGVAQETAEMAQRSADSTLAILSGSFAILGIGLFGLRWTASRLDDG